ncbi:acyltransferase [Trichlorobacter lovleyi]|nr:acyltransferase [Trichlorobacter lovleyi]
MNRLKLVLYYLIISRLPHSRLLPVCNKIRVWYVSKILGIVSSGKIDYFEPCIYIGNGSNVTIGKDCQVNENVFIQGAIIGDYVMIAPNVAILTATHNYTDIAKPMVYQGEEKGVTPVIENDVWIGRNVIIMPGVRLGMGSIIGSGAVVTKDVEPYSIMGGVPARLIRKRT